MQSITIKKAGENDVSLLANLSWQTFFDTYASYNTKEDMQLFMDKNFSKNIVEKEIRDSKTTFALAYLKREVVGYVKLSEGGNAGDPETKNAIEIARLYAVKNKIGSGVGKALMEYSIETARKKNADALWLGVWSQNQRAIQFYRKFGFEKFGDHTFLLGTDAQDDWLMKLDLKNVNSVSL
jgi:ribosomal protein S18 acetylase RimI-like enzyme